MGPVPPGDGKIAVENRAAWITERCEVGRTITRMFVVVSAAMVNLCLCVWQQEDCGYFWKGGGGALFTGKIILSYTLQKEKREKEEK